MALVIVDRVRETTTTSGTGSIALAGPYTGYQAFSVIGNGNTTYYAIIDSNAGAWEVGIGTYNSTGNLLARTTVLASSNGGAIVTFAGGIKDVILTQPAGRAVYLNQAGTAADVSVTGNAGTATTLQTARTINGTSFDGSADITLTASTPNSLTFNSGGAGGASGSTFNGGSALTVSHNTVGASPLAGSTSLTTVGTIGTGTWQGSVINSTYGGTGVNNGGRTLAVNTNSGSLTFTNPTTTLTIANTASVSGTNTGDQTITLTGDVTGSGTGSFATTLATVNANVGSFGSASVVPIVTVNAKGLVTAVSTANITVSTATTATNLSGGSAGTIPYQSAANTTAMLAAGTSGFLLASGGAAAPSWVENSLLAFPGAWVKKAADVATTAALTLNTAQTTIDGVTLSAASRVLVKDQATASQNGIYTNVTTTSWTRAVDADTTGEIAGATLSVDAGTVNGGKIFSTTFKTTDTLGTSAVNWFQVLDSSYTGSTNLTTTGTVTTGTWSASFGAVSGANLTNLTAGNLTGTIPSAVLGNSTHYIGTTAIALNRASAAQSLTGITSIDGSAATLTTGRTISITGDLSYTSGSFNGSANVTGTGTLATVNANVGTFGSATVVPVITVNGKGLITAVSTATVSAGTGTVTSVSAGNGMSFTTITGAGSVSMGTPSTLTTGTTNSASGTTHTHAVTFPVTSVDGLTGAVSTQSARAWVNFNGTITSGENRRASFNVSSVTRNGTGDYTINFTNAMSDTNYSALLTGYLAGAGNEGEITVQSYLSAPTTSAFRIANGVPGTAGSTAITFRDSAYLYAAFFR